MNLQSRSLPQGMRTGQPLWVLATVVSALAMAYAIGTEHWLWLFAMAALVLVLVWPVEVALGTFALLVPFDAIAVIGQGTKGTTLNWYVGAGAAGILFLAGMAGGRLQRPPAAAVWWGALIVWGTTSVTWAVSPTAAWERLPTALGLFGLYLVASSLRMTEKELRAVALLAIAGGVAAGAYAAYSFFHGTFYGAIASPLASRGSLIMGEREADPNQFASSLLVPISLAMGGVFGLRRAAAKSLMFAAVAVIGLGMLVTMSRGSLLALGAVIAVFAARYRVRWQVLLTIAILLVLMIVIPGVFLTRWTSPDISSGAGRLDIWTVGVHMLPSYGIIGAGIDNYPVVYNAFAGASSSFRGFGRNAHNIYLTTWVELGSVGLLFLLLAVRSQLRSAAKAIKQQADPGVRAAIVPFEAMCWAMLLSGFFLDILWRKFFWLSWILLAATLRARQHEVSP